MSKEIVVGDTSECWDPVKEKFVAPFRASIIIEHSLYAISLWEIKYKRSFFKEDEAPQTYDEIVDYIKFMTISDRTDPNAYTHITWDNINEVYTYMNEQQTATKIKKRRTNSKRNGEYITSEVIYFWMSSYNIPFDCDKWHLSRLLTLIEVANEKNAPPDKMSKRATAKSFAELNELRRMKFGTNG